MFYKHFTNQELKEFTNSIQNRIHELEQLRKKNKRLLKALRIEKIERFLKGR